MATRREPHQEKDCLRDDKKHVDRIKKDQNPALDRYVKYEINVSRPKARSVLTRSYTDESFQVVVNLVKMWPMVDLPA
jgi:hypothetical protein